MRTKLDADSLGINKLSATSALLSYSVTGQQTMLPSCYLVQSETASVVRSYAVGPNSTTYGAHTHYVANSAGGVIITMHEAASGNVLLGNGTDNGIDKLQVTGSVNVLASGKAFGSNEVLAGPKFIMIGNGNGTTFGQGDLYLGKEGPTAGGFFTGSSAYASVIYSLAAKLELLASPSKISLGSSNITLTGTNVLINSTVDNATGAKLQVAGLVGIQNLGTNAARYDAINNGGTLYMGLDTLAGGLGGPYTANFWHTGAYAIVFGNSNAERARISPSGNLLITTTVDDGVNRLQVNGNIRGNNFVSADAGNAASYIRLTNTGGASYFGVENSGGTFFAATPYAVVHYLAVGRVLQTVIAGVGTITTTSGSGLAVSVGLTLNSALSAWQTGTSAFQGNGGALWFRGAAGGSHFMANVYFDGGAYKYVANGSASQYMQQTGYHYWSTAPAGLADGTVTMTERMRLLLNGNLLIGGTVDNATDRLQVSGFMSANGNSLSTRVGCGVGYGFLEIVGANPLAFWTNNAERMRVAANGNVLIGTTTDDGANKLQVAGNGLRVSTSQTPASATATGVAGTICWDANFMYVCVATNTWKRTPLTTW